MLHIIIIIIIIAQLGRQPAHRDAPVRGSRGARKELADTLANADMPLSAMLAMQEGTLLWIFPGGCVAGSDVGHPHRHHMVLRHPHHRPSLDG